MPETGTVLDAFKKISVSLFIKVFVIVCAFLFHFRLFYYKVQKNVTVTIESIQNTKDINSKLYRAVVFK